MIWSRECLFFNKIACEFFAFSRRTLVVNNNRNNKNNNNNISISPPPMRPMPSSTALHLHAHDKSFSSFSRMQFRVLRRGYEDTIFIIIFRRVEVPVRRNLK